MAAMIFAASIASAACAETPAPIELETGTESRFYSSDATYYPAQGRTGVVLVPDLIFSKESWADLARSLQQLGIPSVAISATSETPVRRAIQELVRRDHRDVVLLGGGMGAEVVLNTIEQVVSTDVVSGIVLLSPTGGNALGNASVDKLFVVADAAPGATVTQSLHEASAEPKTLVSVPGDAEGQFLLRGPEQERALSAILAFIRAR